MVDKKVTVDKSKRKELFTVLGRMRLIDGKKEFVPNSQKHLSSEQNRIPLNKEIAVTFSEHAPTRSKNQLAYHMVLIGYIAEYTGHSKKDMHDFVMRVVFGEKEIVIGGIKKLVRKSVADDAKMPLPEMQWLIKSDLALCKKLDIDVPTAKQLGYTSNDVQYVDADYQIEDYPEFNGPTAFDE